MTTIDDAGSTVVDVAYKTAAGETRVMPWSDLDPLAVADGSPYREFPTDPCRGGSAGPTQSVSIRITPRISKSSSRQHIS